MGTLETAVAAYYGYEEEEEEQCYEFEPLPTLLEDEENVSLADILSLRDSCLSEQEVWAVCLECVFSLRGIAHSPLFHTLCITPDTLAFNAYGNVCFMEHLSDDPEGPFTPPELDQTGNTFEGHVFSLGATLAASLDFVIEPELEAELGPEVKRLLDLMQQERPEDRPSIQNLVAWGRLKLKNVSSSSICRKLSAIGRRVLSIESVAAFQDGLESSYGVYDQPLKGKRQFYEHHPDSSLEDVSADLSITDTFTWAKREEQVFVLRSDCRSQNSSPERRRMQSGRSKAMLNRSSSVPESNNPPPILPARVDLNTTVTDLTEIGSEELPINAIIRSMVAQKSRHNRHCEMAGTARDRRNETLDLLDRIPDRNQNTPSPFLDCVQDAECVVRDAQSPSDSMYSETSEPSILSPSNHMIRSMMCLNEAAQDEWISLKELLCHSVQPLSVNELWALCYMCLSTLQSYSECPAYLCLDSVYISCSGEMLFLKAKSTGSCDAFYLAPEFLEHGIATEKACVYGVAAVLWATAKFNLTPNQKLAMPRKLKRLLLEMAKRAPIERPSIVAVKKSCRDYLLRQRTTPEEVWSQLMNRLRQSEHRNLNTGSSTVLDTKKTSDAKQPSRVKIGFTPMITGKKLSPVHGPVPQQFHVTTAPHLPNAFTSSATHFTPIVLAQDKPVSEALPTQEPSAGGENEKDDQQLQVTKPTGRENAQSMEKGREESGADHLTIQENTAVRDCSSTSSSGATLVNTSSESSPALTDCEGTTHPCQCSAASSSSFSTSVFSSQASNNMFNSYLLRQDPKTGLLTLLPVQIAVPEPIPGLNSSSLPLTASSGEPSRASKNLGGMEAVVSDQRPLDAQRTKVSGEEFTVQKAEVSHMPVSDPLMNRATPGSPGSDSGTLTDRAIPGSPGRGAGTVASLSSLTFPPAEHGHPSLRSIMSLLRAEFDSCLDSDAKDFKMGEYIYSLRDLQYDTFCSAVSEKFRDLYWDKNILESLYHVVNTKNGPQPGCDIQASSKLLERAGTSSRGREQKDTAHMDDPNHSSAKKPFRTTTPEAEAHYSLSEKPDNVPQDVLTAAPVEAVMVGGVNREDEDFGEHSVCTEKESVSNCEWLGQRGERHHQRSPDFSEHMEDTDSLISELLLEDSHSLSPGGGINSYSCSVGWASAFYGMDLFREDVVSYVGKLGQYSEEPCLETKKQELHQQLMIEKRNLKKTSNFYQKLLHQERKNKGSDSKIMLSKLEVQFEEMKSKVEFLYSVRKYLEVLCLDGWGLETTLLSSLATSEPGPLKLVPCVDPSILSLQTAAGRGKNDHTAVSILQAGTPLGLMAYLYSRNAYVEGYVQQFVYTYRYFCTPQEFLQFLMNKFRSTLGQEPSDELVKIHHRSLDLLHAWVEDCRLVDFPPKASLTKTLEEFLISEVIPVNGRGESLLLMLQRSPKKRRDHACSTQCCSQTSLQEDNDVLSVQTLCKQSSTEDAVKKSFHWRIFRPVEVQAAQAKEKVYCTTATLPHSCCASLLGPCVRSEERQPFFWDQHSSQYCAQQLTLLQQEIFQGCHPVYFLNSRAQGVREKAICLTKLLSPDSSSVESSNLFAQDAVVQDQHLLQLLKYDDSISNWVSAEIVICDSVKTQTGLISKFLQMAKCCYESRNFATAMQILGGLENLIVRQLPAWKHLSAKVCELLEELKAVQVFLKSDNLCLTEGERFKRLPTLAANHILAMHVQQLEIGAFTLASGAYKWPKLRNIAKVVSQVHAFQENRFTYTPDLDLQAYLRQRIAHLSDCDVALLAAENDTNFHQILDDRHSKKIQDTLRRMKATFQ